MDIVGSLRHFFKSSSVQTDNWVFRLHYRVSMVALVACSLLVTGRQYFGDPIDCYSRDDIPPHQLDVFCWIHTTFSIEEAWELDVGSEIPYPGISKSSKEGQTHTYHAYYQWVCFVLFFQGILFYLPRFFWKMVENHRIRDLVAELVDVPSLAPDVQARNYAAAIGYLKTHQGQHVLFYWAYLVAELLNAVNVIGQMILINYFLGGHFTSYGWRVLAFSEWESALRYDPMIRVFPRMTKCLYYRFGPSGDVQHHDAICLLPVNVINEKIYLFMWFWFIILTTLSVGVLIYRLALHLHPRLRFWIALKHKARWTDPARLRELNDRYDQGDWLLLMRLAQNLDQVRFNDMVEELSPYTTRSKYAGKPKMEEAYLL